MAINAFDGGVVFGEGLVTANGELEADTAIDTSLSCLQGDNLRALALEDSPAVLSPGRLCMDRDCDSVLEPRPGARNFDTWHNWQAHTACGD